MALSRRAFLASLTAGAGVLTGTALWLTSPTSFLHTAIRDHFGPDSVSDDDITAFINDFLVYEPRWNALKHRLFGRLGGFGLHVTGFVDGPERLRREALTAFLLGSDAMTRNTPDDPISYLAFPDPYEIGCLPGYPLA